MASWIYRFIGILHLYTMRAWCMILMILKHRLSFKCPINISKAIFKEFIFDIRIPFTQLN